MAAFNAAAWLGSREIRPTEDQLEQIANVDPAFYKVGMDALMRHMHYFVLPLNRFTAVVDASTGYSLAHTARVPFKVVAIDVGCESAGGTTGTADVEKNPSGSPDTWATMSTGAVNVKAAAGDRVDLPVLDGAEDIDAGDELRLNMTGTGTGSIVGGQALLHCFRL
jgi:hypothetical protein